MQAPTIPSAGARRDVQSSAVCADASRRVQGRCAPDPRRGLTGGEAVLQSQEVGGEADCYGAAAGSTPRCQCTGQYDPRVAAPQTETVELDANFVERAQREAVKRGITLKQFVDDALRRWLANEEQALHRPPRVGLGQSVDGLSAAETASEPAARPAHRGK